MSRSYKKHGYDTICSSYGDKYCRQLYHQSERTKTKRILKDIVSEWVPTDNEPFGDAWKNEICLLCKDCSEDVLLFEGFWGDVPYNKYMDEDYYFEPNICYNTNGCGGSYDWELSTDKLFIGKGIDYSVRMSDKWSWASDGGNHFCDDRSTAHRHLDTEIFGNPAYNVPWKAQTFWERYTEERDAKHRCEHSIRSVTVTYRVQHGYISCFSYDDWHELEPNYEYKQITFQEPYKKGYFTVPKWVYDQIGDGEITEYHTARKRPRNHLAHSDWRVDDFMLYRNVLPQTFETSDDLYDWIHKHEEWIISSWLKVKFRK